MCGVQDKCVGTPSKKDKKLLYFVLKARGAWVKQ